LMHIAQKFLTHLLLSKLRQKHFAQSTPNANKKT
jgi:hypothetical protein